MLNSRLWERESICRVSDLFLSLYYNIGQVILKLGRWPRIKYLQSQAPDFKYLPYIYLFHNRTTEMNQPKVVQEKQYFRIEQFSFRNLTPKHQVRTLQILGSQFHRQEPLTTAYSKKYPNDPCLVQHWSGFFSSFMDDAATNNLSVVVLDTASDDKLIAVFICRDLCFVPQSFIDTFLGEKECPNTFIAELEVELRKQLKPDVENFLNQKGKTVDFWGVAIDQAYVGKKVIFKNMLALVEKLAKDGGYTHGHIYAVNGKTNVVAKNANYQLIARVNAQKVVLRDRQVFSQVEQFHKHPSLWLKEL